jgi:hypothetical protein
MSGSRSTHGRDEKCVQYFFEKPEGKRHSEDLGVDGRIMLEWILGKLGEEVSTGFIWLRVGTSGGLL